jgi:hypothetical protein
MRFVILFVDVYEEEEEEELSWRLMTSITLTPSSWAKSCNHSIKLSQRRLPTGYKEVDEQADI